MRRGKLEPIILLPTRGIFTLPHHIYMVCEEQAFDDAVSWEMDYSKLNLMAMTGFVPLSLWSPTQRLNQLSYLPTPDYYSVTPFYST